MYRNVDADKKEQYKPMFLSAGLAVFLTGVTEPIEFMFMFVAPVLYVVYALMAGAAFALADIIDLRVHAFGAIELLTRIPMIVKAGLLQDLINFVLVSVVFFFLNFGVFNFFWGNTVRGDRSGQQITGGIAYTAGPITVGANMYSALVAGSAGVSFNSATGALTNTAARAAQRRWGMGIGGNYRLAPGLDLIAEYVYHSIREQGVDLDSGRAGMQSRAFSNTFIVGSRLAF